MQHRNISTTVAGPTPSPLTTVVDNDPFPTLYHDPDSEVTFSDGNVAWAWGNGTVTPQVTGTLHIVNGDDAKFRVRVDSYDSDGNLVGSAYDKKKGHPRHTDAATDIPVDMNAISGPNIRRAIVALEKEGIGPQWHTKDESILLELDTFDDDVTILGSGIDVGGLGFSESKGKPTEPAVVSWKLGDDGMLTATYTGYLHFDDFNKDAGRVIIRAIDPISGREAARTEGGSHSPPDTGYHHYPDTLAVVSEEASLEVVMQSWVVTDPETQQGEWEDVGSQTVSVAQ
jgi:hypothetical protein